MKRNLIAAVVDWAGGGKKKSMDGIDSQKEGYLQRDLIVVVRDWTGGSKKKK